MSRGERQHLLMVGHVVPGRYDFWVAPGGGVQGLGTLAQAAEREVREETGLTAVVASSSLALVLLDDDWVDRARGWTVPRLLPLRDMEIW